VNQDGIFKNSPWLVRIILEFKDLKLKISNHKDEGKIIKIKLILTEIIDKRD